MISLEYRLLGTEEFQKGCQALSQASVNGEAAYLIRKMLDAIDAAYLKVRTEYREMLDQFAQKDEEGKWAVFKCQEGKEEGLSKAEVEFTEKKAEIDQEPLFYKWLLSCRSISAHQLKLVEVLFQKE